MRGNILRGQSNVRTRHSTPRGRAAREELYNPAPRRERAEQRLQGEDQLLQEEEQPSTSWEPSGSEEWKQHQGPWPMPGPNGTSSVTEQTNQLSTKALLGQHYGSPVEGTI